jgi:hypothetical protein
VLGVHPPTHDLHRWAYRAHVVDSSAALSGGSVELFAAGTSGLRREAAHDEAPASQGGVYAPM